MKCLKETDLLNSRLPQFPSNRGIKQSITNNPPPPFPIMNPTELQVGLLYGSLVGSGVQNLKITSDFFSLTTTTTLWRIFLPARHSCAHSALDEKSSITKCAYPSANPIKKENTSLAPQFLLGLLPLRGKLLVLAHANHPLSPHTRAR